MGKITQKRIIQCTSPTCGAHDYRCSVAHCEGKSFSTQGFDGCGNCSYQRHNFLQAQKRKIDCRCYRCVAPIFQEYGLQFTSPCTRDRRWIRQTRPVRTPKIIPFKSMRRTWQSQVLTQFKAALPKNRAISMLIDQLFKNYPEGFVVYLPKESRITNKQRIARYVARYIRHPAVANTRLHRYDGKVVTFWYEDREGKRHFVTMKVREFIKALIQHIPDRNFKMIRHYGAYSRRTKRKYSGYLQRSLRQATFEDFVTKVNKRAPKCPNCGRKMTLVLYEKGPPTENEVFGCKLADWNHPMLSHS